MGEAESHIKPSASPQLALRQAFWLLGAAFACCAPLLPYLPPWLGALSLLLMFWYGHLLWRRAALPPRRYLLLLTLAGASGIGMHFHTLFGRDPGVAMLALLFALKLLEMRTPRDGFTIVMLGYFLALTQFFYAQSIFSALLMLGGVVLTTAALITLNHAQQRPVRAVRLAGTMLLQALPFMLLLFLLFPRVQGPLWGLPGDAYGGLTGLSDSMAPGSISQLSQSDAIAFRAKFGGSLEGQAPRQNTLYWRGPVLTLFDGRTWRAGRILLSNRPPYANVVIQGIDYTVTLEAHNKPWLFALELPLTIPADSLISSEYQLLAKTPVRTRLRYAMTSSFEVVAGADESSSVLRAALQLPAGFNPRSRALAAAWRNELGNDDAALAQRMLEHIRRENFVYTLSPPLLGEHSVDEFLFDTRRGFCEHYAASFVFMMRAAGIPARVVTGYQGGELNPVDGTLIVRQSDAHAWAEVWLRGQGWQRVDPTAAIAPSRIERNLAGALPAGEPRPLLMLPQYHWLHDMRFRWEALTNVWNQWVIGYNPQRQRDLLSILGMHEPDWQQMTTVLATLCSLLMLGLTAWALHQRQHGDPAQRAWNRFSGKLARIGLARNPWEGPDDYAERVCANLPKSVANNAKEAEEIRTIASMYIQLRYAAPSTAHAQLLRQLKQRIANFPRLKS
jgi:transglutaminase-like putative cysteine protease